MILHKRSQKGFSLIELMLAIAIISIGLISVVTYATRSAERNRAEAAGEQFKEVGQALGNYISRESGVLQACIATGATIQLNTLDILTSATGTTTQGTCTLSNRSLLPDITNARNIFGTEYRLLLKKTSSGSITGLVLSSAPITDPAYPSATIRYDWIGTAMQKAGAASGMTFTGQATSMKGLGGGWELTNTDFALINQVGLLGYRVGYQGTYDDIYLRLDGAYPMRGNLNMGNYNINNATDINFNGWLNGNNALLNNLKTGYISNSGNIQTNTMTATTSITTGGKEDLALHPMPTGIGWDLDFIHTANIYAEGTIATGKGGVINAAMNSDGLITAKNIMLEPVCANINATDATLPGYNTLANPDCGVKDKKAGLLTDRLPQYVSRGAILVEMSGSNPGSVTKPVCAVGSVPRIIVTPQIQNLYSVREFSQAFGLRYDTYTGAYYLRVPSNSAEQMQVYAEDVPAENRWNVYITSLGARDNPALIPGAKGLAETFCDYGAVIP